MSKIEYPSICTFGELKINFTFPDVMFSAKLYNLYRARSTAHHGHLCSQLRVAAVDRFDYTQGPTKVDCRQTKMKRVTSNTLSMKSTRHFIWRERSLLFKSEDKCIDAKMMEVTRMGGLQANPSPRCCGSSSHPVIDLPEQSSDGCFPSRSLSILKVSTPALA